MKKNIWVIMVIVASCKNHSRQETSYYRDLRPDSSVREIGMLIGEKKVGLWVELRSSG
ncbi:hypothetical protein [Telluribacter sp.]|jgi:hypothetical protein|uniref:hypothetical protein n=1 Tax=Telluribacter sp. TaxID=1978767 RepID=UPI002E10F5D3|nr:hypothetical protein [Telluribacter sp.]